MEMETNGKAPSDLQVALALQERLQRLSAGSVSGDEVATMWNLLEDAAQELEISVEMHLKSSKRRKKPIDSGVDGSKSVACGHSCSVHMELPNSTLRGSLPHEILQLIFSRLPVQDIRRLRFLSKAWKTMVTFDTDFHRICDAVHGRLIALVAAHSRKPGTFWIRVFSTKSNRWDSFEIVIKRPALAGPVRPTAASKRNSMVVTKAVCGDGGLVCFVSTLYFKSSLKKTRPRLFITVVNPLTGKSHELPPLPELCNIRMVYMMVSSGETKSFEVFVRGDYKTSVHADDDDADPDDYIETADTVEVYDSTKRCWGRAEKPLDFVFGRRSYLNLVECPAFSKGPGAYNFAGGRLTNLEGYGSPIWMTSYAHYNDHFFVLRLDTDGPANEAFETQSPTYYIEEIYVEMPARRWVKVCKHRCAPFERPPKSPTFTMRLCACSGFLMALCTSIAKVHESDCHESMRYDIKLGWLYDLSTRKWRDLELPALPLGRRTYNESKSQFTVKTPEGLTKYIYDSTHVVDFVCELEWSA
ncbi:hypothetical protein KC19_11G092400 [Ceratodon purpureus]|uniref:F-box domain-containing protein n=1 Tax=Ceratodon purpureus TaxID=3225 RepID=A0A8T0GEN6_CERPU|nr:hypothetical protein KC19_11G092400 [Ceratodon purpureus]